MKLHGLDLFSGIGGNTLALRDYVRTVAYCEQDRHAQAVLLSRMADGNIEPAPIWDDITSLRGEHLNIPIDIIIAGFPCQDISVAGRGEGLDGQRSGLVFEIFRLIDEIKPAFVFLENVPAIRTRGGERVVKELASRGYDCRWDTLSAFDVGAPHKRERWFLLAYSNDKRLEERSEQSARDQLATVERSCTTLAHACSGRRSEQGEGQMEQSRGTEAACGSKTVADPTSIGWKSRRTESEGQQGTAGTASSGTAGTYEWPVEPNFCRVVNGLPYRVDRIKRLGNAVVPAQAREAFERLMGLK